MNCSFGHAGCQKTKAKNDIFHLKIGQNLKFLGTWELYTSKGSLKHVQYKIQKRKKYNFLKKDWFLEIFDFFPKGGPFDVKIVKKNFSIFQKFQKQNWKMTFMGPFKHEQKQSHEFWWSLPLPCRNSEAVYGHPGHNGPPLLWIGLM